MIHCIIRENEGENSPIKDNFIIPQEFSFIFKFNHLTGEVFLTKSLGAKTSEVIAVKAPYNWSKFENQFKTAYEEHVMKVLAELLSSDESYYTIDSNGKEVFIYGKYQDIYYIIKPSPNKLETEEKHRR